MKTLKLSKADKLAWHSCDGLTELLERAGHVLEYDSYPEAAANNDTIVLGSEGGLCRRCVACGEEYHRNKDRKLLVKHVTIPPIPLCPANPPD